MTHPFRDAISEAAERHGLEPSLVAGLVSVESGFNPYAWNPEPPYRYLVNVRTRKPFRKLTAGELMSEIPPDDFPTLAGDRDQEWWGQQVSWGLMQVMGAVAREHGFQGPYLPELTDVDVNLQFGCRHLMQLMQWAGGDRARALAAYNGGKMGNVTRPLRNEAYAEKVLDRMRALEG